MTDCIAVLPAAVVSITANSSPIRPREIVRGGFTDVGWAGRGRIGIGMERAWNVSR